MFTLFIALGAGLAFILAYHTYGRWLGSKIFRLSAEAVCPSYRLRDDRDYVPTPKSVVFGHQFTSIAGTGPIVGPAIAVMWGWLPALLWVLIGSIFIGAVHDLGSLVVSLRNNGQTIGDIAGRVLNRRVRLLFLLVLFLALTIIIAIFGLVIAAVFRMYPAAIFPCVVQIPIAVGIGLWLHRRGVGLLLPSCVALGVMYLTVIYGGVGPLGELNQWMAGWPTIVWVAVLLAYSYVASVLPVWTLLQPRDYINALQLVSALGLVVLGLIVAAFIGGAPPVEGAERQPLEVVAPMVNWSPEGAPALMPFLFITIACGAISGFHCLVSSGTSSKQIKTEKDARFVGYGAMLTEGFLAVIVILACVAGLGLGLTRPIGNPIVAGNALRTMVPTTNDERSISLDWEEVESLNADGDRQLRVTIGEQMRGSLEVDREVRTGAYKFPSSIVSDYGIYLIDPLATPGEWEARPLGPMQMGIKSDADLVLVGKSAFQDRYESWGAAGSLGAKVGAFVDGAANFLAAMGIPAGVAVALMGVLVASFAGTTLDTACRLQRYVTKSWRRRRPRGAATRPARLVATICRSTSAGRVRNVGMRLGRRWRRGRCRIYMRGSSGGRCGD